jgi:hypothetical protein
VTARNATIEGLYRYSLGRMWRTNGKIAVFVMLNPSTADHLEDDPTVSRCMKWARTWDCSGLLVVNMFAWRGTFPADLHRAIRKDVDAVGPRNDMFIRAASMVAGRTGGPVVAAWGAHGGRYPQRVAQVVRALHGGQLMALGTTTAGHPVHPLARVKMTGLTRWPPTS